MCNCVIVNVCVSEIVFVCCHVRCEMYVWVCSFVRCCCMRALCAFECLCAVVFGVRGPLLFVCVVVCVCCCCVLARWLYCVVWEIRIAVCIAVACVVVMLIARCRVWCERLVRV